jgi:lipoprotein-anchoring transpeptidase ErfK/SrfK
VAWFGWGNSNPSTDKVEAANNEPIAQIAEESNTTSVVSEDTLNGAEQSTQSDLLLSQTTSENLADMVENPEVSVAENIIPQENVADVAEFVIDMDAAADSVAATIQEVTGSSDNSEPDNVLVVIESKSIANNGQTNEPRAQWTPTPLPTATPLPTSTPLPPTSTPEPIVVSTSDIPVSVGANERWVDVNLTTQILTAYVGREAVFSTYISSGLPQYATVTGQFRIYLEYESQNMSGAPYGYDYYIEGVPYVMYFHKGFALHGAYWHTNFGTPQSHGCVNLSVSDAAYMWDFADIGTLVNVHY